MDDPDVIHKFIEKNRNLDPDTCIRVLVTRRDYEPAEIRIVIPGDLTPEEVKDKLQLFITNELQKKA